MANNEHIRKISLGKHYNIEMDQEFYRFSVMFGDNAVFISFPDYEATSLYKDVFADMLIEIANKIKQTEA